MNGLKRLLVRRKIDQELMINGALIKVCEIKGGRVVLSVSAPDYVKITRVESLSEDQSLVDGDVQ